MNEQIRALKKAQVVGIIGGLIALVPGVFLFLGGLLWLISSRDHLSTSFALSFLIISLLPLTLGITGFMGGKLATTKPTLACILQLIMASVLSIADISAILGAFALQRLGVQLFLVWPGLFWVGGTLLLNYRKRGASNKESISGKTEKLKRARNLGIIGSSLAITFAIGLFIYGLVLLSNRVVPDFRLGVLSQYTISLMLVITGLISFAASLQLVNHPKPAGVTIAATSFVQVAWLMLTFLDSGSEKTMGLGLIWILWIPFLYGASYKAIKLSQI